jgi:hypothetical protein
MVSMDTFAHSMRVAASVLIVTPLMAPRNFEMSRAELKLACVNGHRFLATVERGQSEMRSLVDVDRSVQVGTNQVVMAAVQPRERIAAENLDVVQAALAAFALAN